MSLAVTGVSGDTQSELKIFDESENQPNSGSDVSRREFEATRVMECLLS